MKQTFPAFKSSKEAFACLLLLLFASTTIAQQRYTVSGYVRDAQTGENLIGAAVFDVKSGQGTTTNSYGFYSLSFTAADSVAIVASYVGYARQSLKLRLTEDLQYTYSLQANMTSLETVEVVAAKEEKIEETTRMSTISVPIEQLKAVPALLGEVDVIKTLQLLPGVQSGTEGASGLYVRGGGPDQNLILMDGAPVYNATHLFGFFSVFNADALNHIELVKGGFPARYGGRLSSVLDISMKEGNMNEFHGEGAIGLIASKLTLEGPLKKDTASFIISARRTYADALARPFMKKDQGVVGYFFHDFNAKLNYRISSKDRLYLSGYTGLDKFHSRYENTYVYDNISNYNKDKASLDWGNNMLSLRWNRVLNNRLFLNTTATYSRYQFDINIQTESTSRNLTEVMRESSSELLYLSNIRDYSIKTDFDYLPNPNHYVRFGTQAIQHQFRPGAIQVTDEGNGDEINDIKEGSKTAAVEASVYVEDDVRLSDKLKVNIGARLNSFFVNGASYLSFEPRIAARYLLNDRLALKASYAKTSQFIHLLTNSGIGLPTDLWVPATDLVRPQRAAQYAFGAAQTLFDGQYEVSVEGYYKTMNGIIEYKEGSDFTTTISNNWENKVTAGKGWAYGAEFFVQKKVGNTSGWVGYTLSWANRQFAELNYGEKFPYRYDRRHDISLVLFHQLPRNWNFSATWVYGTGNAVTLAESRYIVGQNETLDHYSSRNNYRMRAYHRMDLGFSKRKPKSWGEVVNTISLYNAYSRQNPFYMYYGRGKGSEKSTYRQVALFPIIPSFSKSFKF
ncbi:outer membrane receptor for ferrienterochelin and colicin [Pontibacter ummariensis]|uniref:Outer membrane receptor for ferrienterochelin and colicins n=1 Tax=Pontibacter ummariensis TaxID=1610492 RepID=A0A239DYF2_9BACT|nr:TonB-dependent receptor [Pontibacter ummariensis]PRY13686.1 outer membrane receptor for ferrienterochelin and colicin [Pontibacter ummariensis]SNS37525.1 Outer membrane receptor for ferrienterochelin and colicins [Pontibacter ummariensis]